MTVALEQLLGSVDDNATGRTTTVLSPSTKTVTVGRGIVVGYYGYYGDITPSGVTDNLGNSYARVERVSLDTQAVADLWYAPVTSGGSITTITVSHASTGYSGILAAEISGMAASAPAAGNGVAADSAALGYLIGIGDETIPAGGLAVWVGAGNAGVTHTVGAASGSPSTTPILDATSGLGGEFGSLSHALSASEVTDFTGKTTCSDGASSTAGAGAIFAPAVTGATNFLMLEDDSGAYELEDGSGGIKLES